MRVHFPSSTRPNVKLLMYSTLKPTIRFTRNTRCPCSNDCDDHGDFFSRHKAGPPDEPRVDGRWCNVQHQEHMTVQSSCTQNNMWIRHLDLSVLMILHMCCRDRSPARARSQIDFWKRPRPKGSPSISSRCFWTAWGAPYPRHFS